jgi:hypothetical protein
MNRHAILLHEEDTMLENYFESPFTLKQLRNGPRGVQVFDRRQIDFCQTARRSFRRWPALMSIVPGKPDKLVSNGRRAQLCCR